MSRYDTWVRIGEKRGKPLPNITDAPKLSTETSYIWALYVDVSAYSEKLTYNELFAYQSVSGLQFSAFEIETLFLIDAEKRKLKNG
jgi:hypothetical protein